MLQLGLESTRGNLALSYFRACRWLSLAALLLAVVAPCSAQVVPDGPAADAVAQESERVPARSARLPELHYLPDAQGNLVPVPGFSWEDFARLLSIQRQDDVAEQPPKFVMDRVHVEGSVAGERAELQVRIEVTLNETGWIPIPLRLDRCVLLEHNAEGAELRLEPAAASRGLLGWLRAERAGPIRITMRLLKALDRAGTEGDLALTLPRAVQSDLAFRVPEAEVVAEVPEDEGLVNTGPDGRGGSLISVQAVTDTLHLTWSSPSARVDDSVQTLEATGALAVRLDGDGVATTAKLVLRSTGRPIEAFQVRLPSGAILLPDRYPSYSVEMLPASADDGVGVAEIRLYEPNTVAEVQFQTRQDWSPPDRPIDLGGFAVVGAIRQRGHVAIAVADDVRAEWEERFLVRQVDELPNQLKSEATLAGFEYSGQPFSLLASVFPRVTRLTIEPQYLVRANEHELVLNARLKCRIRDGNLHQLKVDLGDWLLNEDGWGPAGLVAEADIVAARAQPLSIPFQRPLTGEFELRFEARRPIPPGSTEIAFNLPRPEATLVGQAQLVVLAADNVRLTPRSEAQMKLVAQRPDPAVNLSKVQQPPQFYRGDVAQAKFESGFEVKPREVRASVSARATWRDTKIEMRQVIKYQVANQALDRVSLAVPRALASDSSLRLTLLDAEPAPLAISAIGRAAAVDVFLPNERLGDFEIEVRYDLPWQNQDRQLELPLVQPIDAALVANELEIIVAEFEPNLNGGEWRAVAAQRPAGPLRWTSPQSRSAATVQLKPSRDAAIQQDLVERAWVQSQLVNELRQDRVVWRVMAPDGALTIRLPEGVLTKEVLAALDGTAIRAGQDAAGNITITWPNGAKADAAHVLELDYRVEGLAASSVGNLPPATLASPGRMKQLQWELLLPTQEHLLGVSSNFALEHRWEWRRGYWARTPTRDSVELELWAGGTARGDLPTQSNRYLVSAFGTPTALNLRSGTRSSLVLAASTITLSIGLLLMFVPTTWRPTWLLVTAVATIVFLAFAGDSAMLLLQSAVPGIAPVAAALALQYWNGRRNHHTLLLQGSTHARRNSSFAERAPSSSATSSHSSRRTIAQSVPGDTP